MISIYIKSSFFILLLATSTLSRAAISGPMAAWLDKNSPTQWAMCRTHAERVINEKQYQDSEHRDRAKSLLNFMLQVQPFWTEMKHEDPARLDREIKLATAMARPKSSAALWDILYKCERSIATGTPGPLM